MASNYLPDGVSHFDVERAYYRPAPEDNVQCDGCSEFEPSVRVCHTCNKHRCEWCTKTEGWIGYSCGECATKPMEVAA